MLNKLIELYPVGASSGQPAGPETLEASGMLFVSRVLYAIILDYGERTVREKMDYLTNIARIQRFIWLAKRFNLCSKSDQQWLS
jgi:hypothetical protein